MNLHRLWIAVPGLLFSLVIAAPNHALATVVVDGVGDTVAADGVCTLREAIQAVNSGTVVNECDASGGISVIEITVGPIVLASALPGLGSMTIQGNGFEVSGNNVTRVFNIQSGAVVTINDLIIADGNAGGSMGGGIRVNNNGQLTLNRCVITGNQAFAGGGIRSEGSSALVEINDCLITNNQTPTEGGAGINNDIGSNMTINSSTIANNSGRYAGGVANYNGSVMLVRNSTVSGNSCTDNLSGGGIENFSGGSSLTIENSTITNNSCGGNSSGGGLYNNTTAPVLVNTIVAGNTAARPDISGAFISGGHNLIGNSTGGSGFTNGVNGDQVGSSASPIDPILGVLADNGGPTPTHALLPGSPAIDAGDNAVAPATDQRGPGFPRILNGVIDIGAFEVCQEELIVTSLDDAGPGSLREAIAEVCNGGTINFDAALTGQSIVLTTGQLAVSRSMTITNPVAPALRVSGNNSSRVFNIPAGAVVTIEDLTIADGNAGGSMGGGIRVNNNGQLTLNRCVITGNQAFAGGGIRSEGSGAVVEINDCLITNNQTPIEGGAGINNDIGSNMTINRSTIANNSGRYAGGVANYNAAVMLVRNSTVSGNSCTDNLSGGGIENFSGGSSLTIENSTITNNSCGGSTSGGGLYNNTTAPVLVNTIVAGNSAARPDISGAFSSGGHNLIGNSTGGSGFTNGVNGDQVGSGQNPIDPVLGALADNGGPTSTHALLPTSPAIDAGDNAATPPTDQRGFVRPQGDAVDIGAYEARVLFLDIQGAGDGSGQVQNATLDCNIDQGLASGDCEAGYIELDQVTLTATAEILSLFDGWSGDCSGTENQIIVTMDSQLSCVASFTAQEDQLFSDRFEAEP